MQKWCSDALHGSSESLVYTLGSQIAKGAFYGGLVGLIFLRSAPGRKTAILYGAGVGLGMSGDTLLRLKSALWQTQMDRDREFYNHLDDLKQDLELRIEFSKHNV